MLLVFVVWFFWMGVKKKSVCVCACVRVCACVKARLQKSVSQITVVQGVSLVFSVCWEPRMSLACVCVLGRYEMMNVDCRL